MPTGPVQQPSARFRHGESVWFEHSSGVRLYGEVTMVLYSAGGGFMYQVRVTPSAVYWVDEGELHHREPDAGQMAQ